MEAKVGQVARGGVPPRRAGHRGAGGQGAAGHGQLPVQHQEVLRTGQGCHGSVRGSVSGSHQDHHNFGEQGRGGTVADHAVSVWSLGKPW